MEAKVVFAEKMKFNGMSGEFVVPVDAKSPIGNGSAPTPKELVLIGLCGCTAMDVVAYLKKFKQTPTAFEVSVNAASTEPGVNPAVFTRFDIEFVVSGEIEESNLIEAVTLSQTKFCGVSAMLEKSGPIFYKVLLNGKNVGEGQAKF